MEFALGLMGLVAESKKFKGRDMKISNINALIYIEILKEYLDRNDIIGYAAARNIRKLTDATIEYVRCRDKLIIEFGIPEEDENGNKTGRHSISTDSPNFSNFNSEINKFNNIEHDVDIMFVNYSEVIGKLTGSQILDIDWMLKD